MLTQYVIDKQYASLVRALDVRQYALSFLIAAFLFIPEAHGLESDSYVASPKASDVILMGLPEEESGTIINEKYEGQTHFVCNGHEYKIPSYIPFVQEFSQSDFFLTASKTDCEDGDVDINIGAEPNCLGGNACIFRSFKMFTLNERESKIVSQFTSLGPRVDLKDGTEAYYSAERCGAFCSQAYLLWRKGGVLFVLGTKYVTSDEAAMNELLKSANSFVE